MQRGEPDYTVRQPDIKKYQWPIVTVAGTLILIIIIAVIAQSGETAGMQQTGGNSTDKTARQSEAGSGIIRYNSDEEKAEAAVQFGKEKLKERNYDAALWYFNEAMGIGEVYNEELYSLMSDAFLGKGDIVKAVEVLDIGIRETYKPSLRTRREYMVANTHMVKRKTYENGVMTQIEAFDETGNIQSREFYNEDRNRMEWDSFEYWEGRLSNEQRHYPGGAVKYRREYDERERDAFYYEYDGQDNLTIYQKVDSYAENGKPTSRTCYDGRGNFQWLRTYEYDENDNCVIDRSYNDDGSLSSWQEYSYDENGYLIRTNGYYADGEFIASIEWEYDGHGNVTKESNYDSEGNYIWGQRYEYEYDRLGNPVRKVQYDDADQVSAEWKYEYEYILISDDINYADSYPEEEEQEENE